MLSDLPRDVAEEVLLKLPVTSLRAVRSTCKKLNTLSKNQSFTKKHIAKSKAEAATAKDFQMIMMIQHRVSLFSINLDNPSIDRIGKLISLQDNVEDLVDICRIFHCDGLLLCLTKDRDNLVVWNPFTNQTLWIKPTSSFHMFDKYALGYEKKTTKKKNTSSSSSSSSSSLYIHKVLRFIHDYELRFDVGQIHISKFEIYNLISKSWKVVVDVRPDWTIQYFHQGVSLKGNTYWYAQEKFPEDGPREISDLRDFLLCFDFTTERFGPRLPLPFHAFFMDTVTLSSVREEQLAVLFQKCGMPLQTVRIWISSKVEQDGVLWNKKVFLEVDMKPLTDFQFLYRGGSFFVDEEKNVAVVLDKNWSRGSKATRCIAYIIGENGYFKKVDLGECTEKIYYPLVCSYVPSSVQINQAKIH